MPTATRLTEVRKSAMWPAVAAQPLVFATEQQPASMGVMDHDRGFSPFRTAGDTDDDGVFSIFVPIESSLAKLGGMSMFG